MKKITIKEIAKKAGVSIGTVDRVLHNRGEVAPKTKELVLQIAKEGNYTTNVYARTLKLNRTYTIAVLLPNDNEYWNLQNKAISETAEKYQSLGLLLTFFTFYRKDSASQEQQAKKLLESNPDGVILAPLVESGSTNFTKQLDTLKIPYVFVDSNLKNANPLSFIGQSSYQAGHLAAKLLNLGFPHGKRTYIVRFHDFDSLNKTIEERIKGFRDFYHDNGFNPLLIMEMDLSKDAQNFSSEVSAEGPIHFFVPSSRAHQLTHNTMSELDPHPRIVGFDLIEKNIACLKAGAIDFIIDQNPMKQGELAIQSFYNRLITNQDVQQHQPMPLEIFTKENLIA
ncbi:LacI family DNA-binding transcriptional regulator [Flagellimonas flava]|uniref:LacI family transcriptional regulator n=1 Tax=Flagellimonas flava TaxID=570519 RepID=A0A1M5PX31_9FLAO|nr:LacI family DNA-binding transcriptional regulator [Allomuricauda flava]SHH06091.1 LacI family transcriptional regulator [Allomuricauda flava]